MEFCLALTSFWESVGFNTEHWRKSLNGEYALVHREQAEILVPNADGEKSITVLKYNDTALKELLSSTEWKPVEVKK